MSVSKSFYLRTKRHEGKFLEEKVSTNQISSRGSDTSGQLFVQMYSRQVELSPAEGDKIRI